MIAIITFIIISFCLVTPAMTAGGSMTDSQGLPPIEAHFAADDDMDGHIHIFVNRPNISRITIAVIDKEGSSIAEYSVAPEYRANATAEMFLHLTKATVASATGVRLRAFSMSEKGIGGAEVFDTGTLGAIPTSGCVGFCMQFRVDCNYACWYGGCLVDETEYWCRDVGGECEGNCVCCCDPPAYDCT